MFEKWRRKPDIPSTSEIDKVLINNVDFLLADLSEDEVPSVYVENFEGVSVPYDRTVLSRRALDHLRSLESKPQAGEPLGPEA